MCPSFCATEPSPKRNFHIRNKTTKHPPPQPRLYGSPARSPSMSRQVSHRTHSPSGENRECQASDHMHNRSISVDGGRRVT